MGRPRKAARPYRADHKKLKREQVLASLLRFRFDMEHNPVLRDLPEGERAELIEEARSRAWDEREARREPILRACLRDWPVDMWSSIFCERPEWEAELDADQKVKWLAWCEEARVRTNRGTLQNILPFPAGTKPS